jgi:glyoxylase-like metal-dependent hydrolase (beta-lactamase superfamily II)
MSTSDWFQIKEVENDIFIVEEPGYVQSYLVNGTTHSALLDTGMGIQNISAAIKPLVREHVSVFNTHWHFDHTGGNALFDEIGISPLESHLIQRDISSSELSEMLNIAFESEDLSLPPGFNPEGYKISASSATFSIENGQRFDLGDRILEALATPGHTRGSMSFLDHRTRSLFVGDLVYRDTFFVQFEDSDPEEYIRSLEKVLSRAETFDRIYPAHGEYALPKEFLNTVMDAFQKITQGAPPDKIDTTWNEICHRYYFNGFDILIKPPGTKGIHIFVDFSKDSGE